MAYKKEILVGGGVGLVIIAGVLVWQLGVFTGPHKAAEVAATGAYEVSSSGEQYVNDTYRFSLTVPQGFNVREVGNVVVIEGESGDGVQIVLTPIDEDIPTLTVERIQADIPDMDIRAPEFVEIGDGRSGLAFLSNNEAFDGASREVWFAFGGQFYQISTYERLDPLVQAIFRTWQFF